MTSRPAAADPFAGLPAELGALARDFDTGMRREMRWLAGAMLVVGYGLAGYLAWYLRREGRIWTPRQEEWLPGLIALAVGTTGAWLWRRASRAPLVRGLVARFPEVRHVGLSTYVGSYGRRRTALVFEPAGPGLNALHIGDMPADDPNALRLLAEARSVCPQTGRDGP